MSRVTGSIESSFDAPTVSKVVRTNKVDTNRMFALCLSLARASFAPRRLRGAHEEAGGVTILTDPTWLANSLIECD